MKSLQRRIEELETTCSPHKEDEELPSEILEMLRRANQEAEGIALSPEQQKEIDCYVAELIALAQQKG